MRCRIGSTSYVYPGDLRHNLRLLAGQVQDVELVLFEDVPGQGNIPASAEARELRSIAADNGMSLTVHLPADLGGVLPHLERARRLALNRRVVDATMALEPYAWVAHVETEGAGTRQWLDEALVAVEAHTGWIGDPARLAIENLESYAPELLLPLFAEAPVARTLDIGHLWKQQRKPQPVLEAWLPHTRVIHLHGVREVAGKQVDHCSLEVLEPHRLGELETLLALLAEWQGVLTLEVFEEDYFSSRAVLERTIAHMQESSEEHVG